MTIDSTGEQLSQAFCAQTSFPGTGPSSASNIINIDSRLDPKTGQRIVLWNDIQRVFIDAHYIKHNGSVVSFMTDDNFKELDPQRISCRFGTVLEVVLRDPGHTDKVPQKSLKTLALSSDKTLISSTATSIDRSLTDQKPGDAVGSLAEHTGESHAISQLVASLSIVADGSTQNSSVAYPWDMNSDARQSFQAYNQLHGSYFDAIMSGQEIQAANIKRSMDKHFKRLQEEVDKNRTLQGQVLQMQRQMAERQEETIKLQKQALDRLATIQSRVQAVVTQTYELHEFPIPRLFIVLPKEMKFRERLGKPFSNQFRLYFLCECGAHTMSEDSRVPHQIHLAKHEGYDLDRPKEFFQKYGSYVLTMMQMIKFGITAAGVVVPSLAHFGLVEGIEAMQNSLNFSKDHISSLVDETMTYIQDQNINVDIDTDPSASAAELDRLEVLEGADLRQLELYLKIKDESRVLGNLYRTVTTEGHVKWVCIDHYRENYRDSAMHQLRDVIEANDGVFIEDKGKIEVRIGSRILAKQFYEALVKARGIQQLEVSLEWDVTLDDLRKFSAAVTKANILDLSIGGQFFEGPALDIINRGRRYDPLVQLMSNGRLHSLQLAHFKLFFSHVSSSSLTMASQLRVLEMYCWKGKDEAEVRYDLARILDACQCLVKLALDTDFLCLPYEVVKKKLRDMRNFETLTVRNVGELIMRVSKGRIEAVEVKIESSNHLPMDMRRLLIDVHITKFTVTIFPGEETRLYGVLHCNPLISLLQVECVAKSVTTIIEIVALMRSEALDRGEASVLCKLEILDGGWMSFEKYCDVVTSKVEFLGNTKTPIISFNIEMTTNYRHSGPDHLDEIFSQHGSSVERLDVNSRFGDEQARILDDSTKDEGSKLRFLALDPTSLTRSGLESVSRIVERSQHLEGLELKLNVSDKEQMEKAEQLLIRYGNSLTGLCFRCDSDENWIAKIRGLCPTRHQLPELSTLRIHNVSDIPCSSVEWISAMVSPPTQETAFSSTSQQPPQDDSISPSYKLVPDAHRAWKPLTCIQLAVRLEAEGWRSVMEAIDFSTLESLSFDFSNFALEELKILVDSVSSENNLEMSLRTLELWSIGLVHYDEKDDVKENFERLLAKAPLLRILTKL